MHRATTHEAATPLHLVRCMPSQPCAQSPNCARCDAALCDSQHLPVDATVLRHRSGSWCPMFIDARWPVSNPVPQEHAA